MSSPQMRDRSYSIQTLLRLNSSDSRLPQFKHFFFFYDPNCQRRLNHRRDKLTTKCFKCGHQQSEEWKYSESGAKFYKMYFKEYDKILIRRKIQDILNKIVEDTFDLLSKDLIQVIKKVETQTQLVEAISLLLNKGLIEPNYMVLYASVCSKLSNLSIHEGGIEYIFQTELLNLFRKITNIFPCSDREKQKYLRTVQFAGYISQKIYYFRSFTNNLIDTMLKFDDVDLAVEGLCKILPLISTKKSTFLDQFDHFCNLKPKTPRINFLMMDALDSIAKEPCKGVVVKRKNLWGTHSLSFPQKFVFRLERQIDSF